MVDITKMDIDLKSAGIPFTGCNSNGDIQFLPEATKQQREQATQMMADFLADPQPFVPVDRLSALEQKVAVLESK